MLTASRRTAHLPPHMQGQSPQAEFVLTCEATTSPHASAHSSPQGSHPRDRRPRLSQLPLASAEMQHACKQASSKSTEDFSSDDLVLPGPVWVTHQRWAPHGGVRSARTHTGGGDSSRPRVSSPPTCEGGGDDRAGTRLFSWEGTQWQQVPMFILNSNYKI